jgi:uncharacterized integral membrane protein (TIGR00697 family)
MLLIYSLLALIIGTVICISSGTERAWIIQASYAGALVASIATAAKLVEPSPGLTMSVAIGLYSMTFLLTDYLGEVYGKAAAMRALYMGIIAELLFLFASLLSVAVEPAGFMIDYNESFVEVFGTAPRLIVASLIAFMAAQFLDITAFDFLKRKTDGRWLLIRNNLSTFLGQTTDTVLFYVIGFYGVPGVDIINLVLITCVVKYLIAIVDTPFLYLAVSRIKG